MTQKAVNRRFEEVDVELDERATKEGVAKQFTVQNALNDKSLGLKSDKTACLDDYGKTVAEFARVNAALGDLRLNVHMNT